MSRWISITLAALWLTLALTVASAGVASPSADDSRLLPYGLAAHLWLLPKLGNRLPSAALANSLGAKIVARGPASSGATVGGAWRFRRLGDPVSPRLDETFHRRLAPRKTSNDPPVAV